MKIGFIANEGEEVERILKKKSVTADVTIYKGSICEILEGKNVTILDDTDYQFCLLEIDGTIMKVMSSFNKIFSLKRVLSNFDIIIISVLIFYGFLSTYLNIEHITNYHYEFSVSHAFALFVAAACLTVSGWALTKVQVRQITIHWREITNVYFDKSDPEMTREVEKIDAADPKEALKGIDEFEYIAKGEEKNEKEITATPT